MGNLGSKMRDDDQRDEEEELVIVRCSQAKAASQPVSLLSIYAARIVRTDARLSFCGLSDAASAEGRLRYM
jgi:hypothetical protein